jgi:hypothetical protein
MMTDWTTLTLYQQADQGNAPLAMLFPQGSGCPIGLTFNPSTLAKANNEGKLRSSFLNALSALGPIAESATQLLRQLHPLSFSAWPLCEAGTTHRVARGHDRSLYQSLG